MNNTLFLLIAIVAIFISFFILAFLIHNREQKNLISYDGQIKATNLTNMNDLVLFVVVVLSVLSLLILIIFYVNEPKTVNEDYMNQRKDLVKCCTSSTEIENENRNKRCCEALKDFDDKYGDKLMKKEK